MQSALNTLEGLRSDLFEARGGMYREHPRYQSLLNLRHYLILRSKDWTELQEKLFLLSLSSLGRSYAHVAASVDTLYEQLSSSLGHGEISAEESAAFHHLSISAAQRALVANSHALFGAQPPADLADQTTALMVTLPSTAAKDGGALIRSLASAGVNVFRINTAHDTPEMWRAMARMVQALNEERFADETLKIFVDLAGPKIRTGRIRRVKLPVRVGSNRQEKQVLILPAPARTRPERLDPNTLQQLPAQLAVEPELFEHIDEGDMLKVTDANGKRARIIVLKRNERGAIGMIAKKIIVDETSTLRVDEESGFLSEVEAQPDTIRLFKGDRLRITEGEREGHSALHDEQGNVTTPASISCTLRGFASFVRSGDRIFIDDGKIALVALAVEDTTVLCEVVQAKPGGTLLKEEKGINLPDTYLKIPAFTPFDKKNVLEVMPYADMLGISFCQSRNDVADLQHFLEVHRATHIGIVPKIETRHAVYRMPQILEELLLWERSGVMIARGDLAIETGFENLAAIQESLLDICNAAHIPVIWATQVLESQMKNNLPSRAEITDAAMAGRAECVMLNKGPFVIDTMGVLRRILDMVHQSSRKNRQLLRREALWDAVDVS